MRSVSYLHLTPYFFGQKSKIIFLIIGLFINNYAFSQNWQYINSRALPYSGFGIELQIVTPETSFTSYHINDPWILQQSHGVRYDILRSQDCLQSLGSTVYSVTGNTGCFNLRHLQFLSPDTGFMVRTCQNINHEIFSTTNGGLSWQFVKNLYCSEFVVYHANPLLGFYIQNFIPNTIYRLGQTSPVLSDTKYIFGNNTDIKTFFHFISDSIGFVVSQDTLANAVVLRTIDQGATWSEVLSLPNQKLYNMDFNSNNNGILVGSNGLVLRTIDSGLTWSAVLFPTTTTDLKQVSLGQDNIGYIGGGNTLYKSTNDGASWSIDASWFYNNNIYSITDFDSITYVATKNSEIIYTYKKGNNSNACSGLGIDEIEKKEISIYPNPVSTELNIDLPIFPQKKLEILVFDVNGRLVYTDNKLSFSIEDLNSGIYFVKVVADAQIYTKTFVKN